MAPGDDCGTEQEVRQRTSALQVPEIAKRDQTSPQRATRRRPVNGSRTVIEEIQSPNSEVYGDSHSIGKLGKRASAMCAAPNSARSPTTRRAKDLWLFCQPQCRRGSARLLLQPTGDLESCRMGTYLYHLRTIARHRRAILLVEQQSQHWAQRWRDAVATRDDGVRALAEGMCKYLSARGRFHQKALLRLRRSKPPLAQRAKDAAAVSPHRPPEGSQIERTGRCVGEAKG